MNTSDIIGNRFLYNILYDIKNAAERCTRKRNRFSYNPDPTSSLNVGSQKINLEIVGNPILIAICKALVWIGCNVSYDKICIQRNGSIL